MNPPNGYKWKQRDASLLECETCGVEVRAENVDLDKHECVEHMDVPTYWDLVEALRVALQDPMATDPEDAELARETFETADSLSPEQLEKARGHTGNE